MAKIVTAQEAVSHIKDDSVLYVNGMLYIGGCEPFYKEVEKRFLETGHPKNMTLFAACGVGHTTSSDPTIPPELANRMAYPGLVTSLITSHVQSYVKFLPMIMNNEIECYIIPQGTVALMLHSAARRAAGTITRIGLKTHADPRYQGGAFNEISKRKICKVVELEGQEYLFYPNIYPDVCLIRGTTADANGNVTFEHECCVYDPLAVAEATHNNGGIVIVQVERLNGGYANPQLVKLPGRLIDYLYVDPDQKQTANVKYDGSYSGEIRIPAEKLSSDATADTAVLAKRPRSVRAITRRAALELQKGDIVNLGIGMATSIGLDAVEMGTISMDDVTFTVELGIFGGVPAGSASFGANFNPDAVYEQASQFEFYEGFGLDKTFVGALEFDSHGNVNVCRSGKKLIGVGGFNYVVSGTKCAVFCTKFMSKSDYVTNENGKLVPVSAGFQKVKKDVEYINFNGEVASQSGQRALYITERCVFELVNGELVITEVSPYVDLQKDVLDMIPFPVKVSDDLKPMPQICFE